MTIEEMALIIKDDMTFDTDYIATSSYKFCENRNCDECIFNIKEDDDRCHFGLADREELTKYLNEHYPERMI
jgi:hypothetical protein